MQKIKLENLIEEKKKKEEEEKKAKIKLEEKKTYTIIVEAIVPIKARYTVIATNEREAVELLKKNKFQNVIVERPRINVAHMRELFVYLGNTVHKLLSIRLR